jgi:hypothetical protein
MRTPFLATLSSGRKIALATAMFVVAVLLFLWLALPRIIQSQAVRIVAEKSGHTLTLDRPEFNPLALRLKLGKLSLATPDGQTLLAFDGLMVDLSAASLPRRALAFDAIRIDGLKLALAEQPGGTLNWSPFLEAFQDKEDKPQTGLPRIDIDSFVLAGGQLDFADRRRAPGFATQIAPLDVTLTNLSTLPDDQGRYSLAAQTALGARVDIQGEVALNPLAVTGKLSLDDLDLGQLAPYLQGALAAAPAGKASLSAAYRIGNNGKQLDVAIDSATARLSDLRLPLATPAGVTVTLDKLDLNNGHWDLASQTAGLDGIEAQGGQVALPGLGAGTPRFAALALKDAKLDLGKRHIDLSEIRLAGSRVEIKRLPDGRIDGLQALAAPAGPQTTTSPTRKKSAARGSQPPAPSSPPVQPAQPPVADQAAPAQPWQFKLDHFVLADAGLILRDASVSPVAELALEKINARVDKLSQDLSASLPVKLDFAVRGGGQFSADGSVIPGTPAADLKFKLDDLSLKPAQPYLATRTTLKLAGGTLSSAGRVRYADTGPSFEGEFKLNDLRLDEAEGGNTLLAWKSFGSRALSYTPQRLDLGELRLNGLDTQLIIYKDRSINFKKVLKSNESQPAAAAPAAPATTTATAAASAVKANAGKPEGTGVATQAPPDFLITIDRIRFFNSEMDFADQSLLLPFGTRIHKLRGSIANLSNRPDGPGQVELDGEVDDYGMARAVGQIDLFSPTDYMDLRVIFRNVEMTRLTPYTATFAGRKIESGKLSLDLQYGIKKRQLQSDNRIIMDRLILGERVNSPTAKDLPLDLAIAVLQDADGRIDLGLPISGSLDDPEFSYGQIVWKAIANVVTKIVTAPFRALGALFGGSEKLEGIAFEAGAGRLSPPEREKLVRLAEAMTKRPALLLTLAGSYADADRVALQDVQLRRALLTRMGQAVPERGDPGPLSSRQPKVQAAIEALFDSRFGGAELAALKEGFRRANPGQLEEGLGGKMLSRLTGLLREKKTLSENEVDALKGADFHAVLYDRLREKEDMSDDRLRTLAQARADNALSILKDAGTAADRLQVQPPDHVEATADGVPLKLGLEARKIEVKKD